MKGGASVEEVAASIAQSAVDAGYAQEQFSEAVNQIVGTVVLWAIAAVLATIAICLIVVAISKLVKGDERNAYSAASFVIPSAVFFLFFACFGGFVFSDTVESINAFSQDPYAATLEDVKSAIQPFYGFDEK